jgi:hypothetical protein
MDVAAQNVRPEEKQISQICDLMIVAFTQCDGSIRAGSHRIKVNTI